MCVQDENAINGKNHDCFPHWKRAQRCVDASRKKNHDDPHAETPHNPHQITMAPRITPIKSCGLFLENYAEQKTYSMTRRPQSVSYKHPLGVVWEKKKY